MRVVQVTIPTSRRGDVLAVLEGRSLDYVLTPETRSDETELLQFPVPPDAVDPVLDALEDAGVDSGSYTVLLRAEVARAEDADRQSEQVEDGDERIGHDEIPGRALGLNPSQTSYYAMSVLSAVVATAGLLLNSPAIVSERWLSPHRSGRYWPGVSASPSATANSCNGGSSSRSASGRVRAFSR